MTDADIIAEQREQLRQRDEQIDLLKEQVDLLIRKLLGSSSEKINPDQLQLQLLLDPDAAKKPCAADCEPDAPAAESESSTPRSSRRRKPGLPKDIEVIEEVVVPDEVQEEPEAHRKIGEQVSERLEFKPARYWLRRIIRETYVKHTEPAQAPLTAPLEPCLLEGSMLSPSLAAQLLTSKFCDHLPFYRQQQILEHRHGIRLGRNTMCHWAEVCSDRLEPLYKLLVADLRTQSWLHVDETPIDYLAPGHGQTKKGYFWTYLHPEVGVLYDWHTGRSHECLDTILTDPLTEKSFQGVLLSDGFSAYGTWQRKHEGIILAACWAHVRRKFHEALPHHPEQAAPLIDLIARLFRIETRLRNKRAGPEEILQTRQRESVPLLDQIKDQLTSLNQCLPKSLLGRARDYTLGLWTRLQVFLEHGEIPIDNNPVENAIRPTKLGAKNWLCVSRKEVEDVKKAA